MSISVVLLLGFQVIAGQVQPRFDIQGHRGARGLLPENSMAGFLRAVDLGVNTLEIDVVIAADSTVVVSHEPWMLETICSDEAGRAITHGKSHNIFQLPYEAVARYDCGNRGHPDFPRQERQPAVKPRLLDVIESVENYVVERDLEQVRYNIEIKSRMEWDGVFTPTPPVFVQLVYDVLATTGTLDRVTVQSFDTRSLQAAHRIGAPWRLAVLVRSDTSLTSLLARLGFTPQVYSPNFQVVDESVVRAAHARGMLIIPWTVNEVSDMQRLKELGVDGLITDYPDLAVAINDP